MTVTKPDATVFDNADDSIATSRAELHTLATSFNTIADDYNAGNLGGTAATSITELIFGFFTEDPTVSIGVVFNGTVYSTVISDIKGDTSNVIIDTAGGTFSLVSGTYYIEGTSFGRFINVDSGGIDNDSAGAPGSSDYGEQMFLDGGNGPNFFLEADGTQVLGVNIAHSDQTSMRFKGIITSTGTETYKLGFYMEFDNWGRQNRSITQTPGSGGSYANQLIIQRIGA